MPNPESAADRASQAAQTHLAQFTDEDMAYHEAGHAVIHHGNGGTVRRVSIDRSDVRRGVEAAAPRETEHTPGLGHTIAVLVAGDVAGRLHGSAEHVTTAGSRVDYDQAFRAAAHAGFDADETRAMIDSKWQRVRDRLQEPATWQRVETIAQALLQRRTLDEAELTTLLAG